MGEAAFRPSLSLASPPCSVIYAGAACQLAGMRSRQLHAAGTRADAHGRKFGCSNCLIAGIPRGSRPGTGTHASMANNDDSLLREVEEELRRERMEQLWKQYGTYFVIAALAVVVVVAGWKYYQSQQISAAYTAGAAYEKASSLADDSKSDEARKAFEDLVKSAPSGYAALARLKLAGLENAAGEKAKALAQYEALAASNDADPLLRSFAKLQAAALKIGDADFTEVENRLNDLTADTSPWRANARELVALAAFRAGKKDVARKTLEQLLADRNAPSDVRERAQVIMAQIIAEELAAKGTPPAAAGKPDADGKSGTDAKSGMAGAADKSDAKPEPKPETKPAGQ